MNRVYRSHRNLTGQIMRTLGCEYDENQVGMFLWGRIPDSAESGEAIANKVLHEINIFLTPGFIFGSRGECYTRISLCCKSETLEEALKRIENL